MICHNEAGPHNTVYRGGRPVAFIDWDFAAPAPREWDIAYALWRFVPLYGDSQCAGLGWPVRPRGPRIALFLDAYGRQDRGYLLDVPRRRKLAIRDTIARKAEKRDPAYQQLRAEGRLAEITVNILCADRSHDEWARFLH